MRQPRSPNAAYRDGLDERLARLKLLENGEMFIGQIQTAMRVFSQTPSAPVHAT